MNRINMNVPKKALIIGCVYLLLFVTIANSQPTVPRFQQDTIRLSLDSAENIFIKQNLTLLAQKYNIDVNKALEIQAKLFPNPNLSIARGPIIPLHNPDASFFNNAENQVTVSQLVLLAGKRNKQIKIAEANTKLAEYQFYDLIRTLKYTLRTDFYTIYYLKQSANVYTSEINALQQVENAFKSQEGKGYISQKEVVRIKAQLYAFESEYNDLINQINDTQSELRLVLQDKNVFVDPIINHGKVDALSPEKYSLSLLIDSAHTARTDLLIARQNTEISRLNYTYQKALATPDLTLNISYDKQGSYVHDFHSIGAAMDLPFFNRNQGNIKSAKSTIAYYDALQQSTAATVEEQISRALQKAFDQEKLYKKIDPSFSKDFEKLKDEVLINYQRRNIGLLDFLDFYDSYKQNTLQINNILFNRVSAYEDLNYYTGASFFN